MPKQKGKNQSRRTSGPGVTSSPVHSKVSRADPGKPDPKREMLVVGVGASAGGVEALGQLFKHLPDDTGLAFIVIQHLDPKHQSLLPEILSRSTGMGVMPIRNRAPIQPNTIVVLPPNREATVKDGVMHLAPRSKADGQFLVIDTLFRSMARTYGNRAVGIVLSGNGSDGMLGATELKAEGGVTFAQDEKSAGFTSMPASAVRAGVIDFVMPPAQIAEELLRIARHPAIRGRRIPVKGRKVASSGDGQPELVTIFSLLRALHGVDFSFYKHTTLRRRILRRMILRRLDSLSEYVQFLQHNPVEVDALFHDLLINVTAFFRDPHTFDVLKKRVFPRLLKSHSTNTPLRLWVPGCSTGEEVYSLAIALFEFLGKDLHGRNVQIFGTDISEAVLAKARAGIYPESMMADISPERLRRFFTKTDGSYQISKFVRDRCVFARQNVVEDPPFSNLDLISCRNVLIYLGPVLQKKVMPVFHYALRRHGILVLGGSETVGVFADLFTLVDKKNKVYSKRDGRLTRAVAFAPRPAPLLSYEVTVPKPLVLQRDLDGSDLQNQVDRVLLSRFAPAGIVINSRMEVLQFRGQTGRFLEHSPGDASLNVMKLVRHELLVELRTALSRAMKSDGPIRKDGIRFEQGGGVVTVNIEVLPIRGVAAEPYYIVLFQEGPVTEPDGEMKNRGKGAGKRAPSARDFNRLEVELDSTRESLQSIIEEQEATNEELKSANEEIQSSNEELQSTNEELETAKEELQSTNEELTTLNEELQTRNTELSQVNNDLNNLLSSVSMPIVMLGIDLTVRRFTPAAERLFNLISTDVGRRMTDINPNILLPHLDQLVSQVIETLHIQEHEVQDREGRWYSLRIRPYRTIENKIDGAVLMLVDISEAKRAIEELSSIIRQPLLTLSGDLTVTRANGPFHEFFGTDPRKTEGQSVYTLRDGSFNIPALRGVLEDILPEKNRVDNLRIEHDFRGLGRRVFHINARRMYQQSKGSHVILLAIDPEPPKS